MKKPKNMAAWLRGLWACCNPSSVLEAAPKDLMHCCWPQASTGLDHALGPVNITSSHTKIQSVWQVLGAYIICCDK